MIAAGVASPMAQGQAMINTADGVMNAARQRGGRRMRVPEKRRQPIVNLPRGIRRESPPERRGNRDGNDDRHEDTADAVANALNVRAAGLRALHGGDDVGESGGFAGGGHAQEQTAIEVDGAGVELAADFFVNRR